MTSDRYTQILQLVDQQGILRAQALAGHGIPRVYLQRLLARGELERIGRGLYMRPHAEVSLYHSLATVARHVPVGVVALLSALAFHELTTQLPHAVWLALPPGRSAPRIPYPPLQVVHFSGQALTAGVEEHTIENVAVPIYGVAKTVADCFKFRNKIGVDVAVESLRQSLHERRCSIDELLHYAAICRVAKVMQPYLEALV
jgi:predicted transcriptional regulator of viral defense system